MPSRVWKASMKRREFISFLVSVAATPLAARTQHPERMRRIGVPFAEGDPQGQARAAEHERVLSC